MFTERVSMRCSAVQYENQLRAELQKMGYTEVCITPFTNESIIVNDLGGILGHVSNGNINNKNNHGRFYLDLFNATLYLAYAAMTNKEFGGYGEYWVFLDEDPSPFTKGKLYRCIGRDYDGAPMFINDNNVKDGYHSSVMLKMFRKATKLEIEAELGKEAVSTDPIISLLHQVKDLLALIINTEYSSEKVKSEFTRALRAFSERGIPVSEELKKLAEMKYNSSDNNAINYGSAIDRDKVLHELSKSLFGKAAIVMTRESGIKIGREDLCARSLYVGNNYDVKLHKLNNGDTIIEFKEGK